MPNDAKLGFLIGLGLFIAVAVVYFRSDGARNREESPAATSVKPAPASHQPPRGQTRPTKARPAVHADEIEQAKTEPERYTVSDGDTLTSLAERFYGDKQKSAEIYRANIEVLNGPEELRTGTVLVIPKLNEKTDTDGEKPEP
jgi:nucleoid-associated protein YgaU